MKIWLAGAILAAGLAASATARPIGPDVVVSTVGSTFTKYGTLNYGTASEPKLVTAYAVTTISCNIGDADAIWIDSTNTADPNRNKHPVIGTQMYRLMNGRFEQIGMSWLKHGFCAADAPSCTNLVPGSTVRLNSSCDWLGLFETDTYSASLNGGQTYCGPRSEVNASTGAFPYPYLMGWNQTGNCIYKRLQISNTDLNPSLNPAARYFCEVHYVTTDEVTTTGPGGVFQPDKAAIRGNNCSYRETLVGSLSVTSGSGCSTTDGGYNLAFTGNTVALKPAIEAWKAVDPAVTLVTIDIPNDGRVIIGYKVTDLGNGMWNYEYAIYNHNSNRSIGSFSLPKKGPEVVPTNVGFHAPLYHSGEPYSSADWVPSVTDGRMSWATTDYATNPNANAIRWSTTYNFRFQANKAPSEGTIQLGLFRPDANDPVGVIDVPGVAVPIDPCAADFNADNVLGVQDLFDFLHAYFSNDPAADLNSSSDVTVEDIFVYLASYFTGC